MFIAALTLLLSLSSTVSGQASLRKALDYDGDGKADPAIFRPSNNNWYLVHTLTGGYSIQNFAVEPSDFLVPGDYDGDGKGDIAFWRDSEGSFYYIRSSNSTLGSRSFGQTDDEPVARDYDGDGTTDFAVVRRIDGVMTWYVQGSTAGFYYSNFGIPSDYVAPGDYDGDGRFDFAIYRAAPNNGASHFYVSRSSLGYTVSTSWGDVMNSVLANAILAFLESSQGGSLLDLKRFLVERTFREKFLHTVGDDEICYYWRQEFTQIKGKPYGPLLTRLDTFLRSKIVRNIVAQKENKLNFRRIMDESKILLVRLSHGAVGIENSYMLGSLLVSKLYHAALSRQNILATDRRPYFLYLDEAHNFITDSMTQILSGARKFGLGLVTAHQQLQQFPPDILDSILANSYTRICFRLDEDAERLAKGLSFFSADDLKNLGVGKAICRLEQSQFDFNLETFPLNAVPTEVSEKRRAEISKQSRTSYAKPKAEVENEGRREAALPLPETHSRVKPIAIDHATSFEKSTIAESAANNDIVDLTIPKTGRGGRHHQELQKVIRRMGEKLGFHVEIEKPVLGGAEKVDVSLEREDLKVACEVSVTTADYEIHNAGKCLAAGYDHVFVVVSNEKKLPLIRRKLQTGIPTDLANKVKVCSLMELLSSLQKFAELHLAPRKAKQSTGTRLSFSEACELLGKAPSTVYRWVNEGRVPFYRVGREYQFDRDELLLLGKQDLSGKRKVVVEVEPLKVGKATPKGKKEQDARYRKLLNLD